MAKLPAKFPVILLKGKGTFESLDEAYTSIRDLVQSLTELRDTIVDVVNRNEIPYISQNAQPTPVAGEFMLWKDADAATGQPTHYIVYNDGGTVVIFASVEVVP